MPVIISHNICFFKLARLHHSFHLLKQHMPYRWKYRTFHRPSTKRQSERDTMMSENERCFQSQSLESASLSSEETESNHTGGASDDSSISIAAAETRNVNQWKIVVLVVIAVVAGICGACTYAITQFQEEDDFQIQVRCTVLPETLPPIYSPS
jgi:hypothetical protein